MTTLAHSNFPQTYARIGGFLYLFIIIGGGLGEAIIRNSLIVPGNATATSEKILASEFLWRVGVAGELFMLVCTVILALIFYILLRPVNRDIALLMVFFNLMAVALEATNELNLLATLFPLGNAEYLKSFEPQQLQALAQLPIKTYAYGFGNGLIFFGVECLILGHLIYRSGYLPKIIGILMGLAGLSYLVNSFTMILSPPLASQLFPAIMLPVLVGEGSFCLWLLTKGVDISKWQQRGGAQSGYVGLRST